jgi:hypothetical protein
MKYGETLPAASICVDFDIVADCLCRPKRKNAAGAQQFFCPDALEQFLRVIEELTRLLTDGWVLKDRRIPAAQFPGVEERRPIDVRDEIVEGDCLRYFIFTVRRIDARP